MKNSVRRAFIAFKEKKNLRKCFFFTPPPIGKQES